MGNKTYGGGGGRVLPIMANTGKGYLFQKSYISKGRDFTTCSI